MAPQTTAEGQRARWTSDIRLFAREAIGIELWDKQAEIAQAIIETNRVAVRSGHKIGKSALVSVLALWWVFTQDEGRVVITAPTGRQVKRIVWREVRAMVRRARAVGLLDIPEVSPDPGTGIQWEDGRYIIGFSTGDSENMGGFSGKAMLFLVDEASGVEEAIYEAIEGNTAGGDDAGSKSVAKIVLTGNPTRTVGTFFAAFHHQRALWRCFRISSEETPNAQSGEIVIPGLATRKYIEEKKIQWGEDSDLYRVRVLGDFPKQGSRAVIPMAAVEAAQKRYDETPDDGLLELGVDVARFGEDDSCVVARRGRKVLRIEVVHGFDLDELTGLVVEIARDMKRPAERPLVKVDVIGIGAGVAVMLAAHDWLDVAEVNVAEASNDPDRFNNLRSQLWFAAGEWLADEKGAIPPDEELAAELLSAEYTFTARGTRAVLPKDEIKKSLGRSPNRADALCMALLEVAVDCSVVTVAGRYS